MRFVPSDAAIALSWHRQVWYGRPQPRRFDLASDLKRQAYSPVRPSAAEYRFPKQQKFARRFMAAQRGERPFPLPH